MLVPHGTESSRSISFSERGIRRAAMAAAVCIVATLVAYGALVSRLSSPGSVLASASDSVPSEVSALRLRLSRLNSHIDNIRLRESRLRADVSAPLADVSLWRRLMRLASGDSPTTVITGRDSAARELTHVSQVADSLIDRAGDVSLKFATLADSVNEHRRSPPQEQFSPTPQWLSTALAAGRLPGGVKVARMGDAVGIAAPAGTLLLSPAPGRVVRVVSDASGGQQLYIDHEDGYRSMYVNCGEVLVREGEQVARSQVIARTRLSPKDPTAMLRFELRRGNRTVAPTAIAEGWGRED
jgi:murein DD-endopeptidase MepM/ murein hydrolase activator NlpD